MFLIVLLSARGGLRLAIGTDLFFQFKKFLRVQKNLAAQKVPFVLEIFTFFSFFFRNFRSYFL